MEVKYHASIEKRNKTNDPGGLNTGTTYGRTAKPDGLVSKSVENGTPVIYVGLNYRLNSKMQGF